MNTPCSVSGFVSSLSDSPISRSMTSPSRSELLHLPVYRRRHEQIEQQIRETRDVTEPCRLDLLQVSDPTDDTFWSSWHAPPTPSPLALLTQLLATLHREQLWTLLISLLMRGSEYIGTSFVATRNRMCGDQQPPAPWQSTDPSGPSSHGGRPSTTLSTCLASTDTGKERSNPVNWLLDSPNPPSLSTSAAAVATWSEITHASDVDAGDCLLQRMREHRGCSKDGVASLEYVQRRGRRVQPAMSRPAVDIGLDAGVFSCRLCHKKYATYGAMRMHARTHTLPCRCSICGKAFSRPWLLQGHVRTHTGERPFACSLCRRAFADRSNLRAHLQTHAAIKKYACSSCDKTFSRMSLLVKHTDRSTCRRQ